MKALLRVDPRTDPLWHSLAAAGGSLFTSPPWISAVCATYGFTPRARVAVEPSGRPVVGTAWVDVHDLRGDRRLALPFSDRADPIVADLEGWASVSFDAFAGDLPFTMRCLANSPAASDPRLTAVGEAAWHTTSLDRSLDDLHAALRGSCRRNLAVAERSGVKVEVRGDLDAVRAFHRMQVGLRKHKYRLLAQPQAFFEQIWAAFAPDDGIRTLLATVDGEVVAGSLVLLWGDTLYYKFGASRAEFLHLCPNNAVHWEMLRWAHERGLRAVDWGLSDLSQPGLIAYKRKWASTEGRLVTLNSGGAPLGRSAEVEEALHKVTELLTEPAVPDDVTERAGAALYRFFC